MNVVSVSIRINMQWRICIESGLKDSAAHGTSGSWTTTERNTAMARTPTHPGEVLAEELEQLGVSPTELSRHIRVPANL